MKTTMVSTRFSEYDGGVLVAVTLMVTPSPRHITRETPNVFGGSLSVCITLESVGKLHYPVFWRYCFVNSPERIKSLIKQDLTRTRVLYNNMNVTHNRQPSGNQ